MHKSTREGVSCHREGDYTAERRGKLVKSGSQEGEKWTGCEVQLNSVFPHVIRECEGPGPHVCGFM